MFLNSFKRTIVVSVLSLIWSVGYAQLDDLMIVEYVDWNPGSGFSVKIYNPTSQAINLNQYYIQVFNNGGTSGTTNQLNGMLPANATVVVGNSTGSYPCVNDININSAGVNDNDCIALTFGNGTNFIDMINLYGVDVKPKVDNISGALKWHTLVRKPDNCTRYTSVDGISSNSWPSNPSQNVDGWIVSSPTCLQANGASFNLQFVENHTTATICQGESILLQNALQTTAGVYRDTLAAAPNTCVREIKVTTLNVLPATVKSVSFQICLGDSVFAGGSYQTSAGIYYDTVSTPNACDTIIKTELSITPTPSAQLFLKHCNGVPVVVNGNTYFKDTIFTYLKNSPHACDTIVEVFITSLPQPSADYMYQYNPEDSTDVTFTAMDFADSYQWFIEDVPVSSTFNNVLNHKFEEPGLYEVSLVVTNSWGCGDTVSKEIEIPDLAPLYIPNAFTPNGDGVNDVFLCKGSESISFEMAIYNRWGTLIFESNDINKAWMGNVNGQEATEGTYMYMVTYDKEVHRGFLTLFR